MEQKMEVEAGGDIAVSSNKPTEQNPPVAAKNIKPWHLCKFASCLDYLVLFFGVSLAAGQGMIMPTIAIMFGNAVAATAPGVSSLEEIMPTLKWLGMICAGVFLTGSLWHAAFLFTSERQCARMRKAYLEAVLRMDMSWFDLRNTAELPTRMATEVQAVQDALGVQSGQCVQSTAQFVTGFALAFLHSVEGWKMSFVICGTLAVSLVAGAWMAVAIKSYRAEKHASFVQAGVVAEEAFTAIQTVAAFGGEERESNRFESHLRRAKRAGVITGLQMGGSLGLFHGSFSCMYGVAIWFAATYLNVPGSDIITVFVCLILCMMSLGDLKDPMMKWGLALSLGGRMFEILDEKPRIESGCVDLGEEVDTIREVNFINVSFSYPAQPELAILSGVSLCFKQGQKLAVVGGSGSGKSTLLQLLVRFYDPSSGQITVNGTPLQDLALSKWRTQIGYVGQDPVLFANSVWSNLINGDSSIPRRRVIQAVRKAQAYDFIQSFPDKLNTYVGVGGNQLSAGQKQRIAIARALIRSPQILLLDEATSALDTESERLVQAAIDNLQERGNASLVTISIAHRLSAVKNSDVIFLLQGGRVEEQGSHVELMARQGCYWGLMQSQELAAAAEEGYTAAAATDPPTTGTSEQAASPPRLNQARMAMAGDGGPQPEARSDAEIEEARLAKLREEGYRPPMRRLLGLCRREWIVFPLAFLGSLVAGTVMPGQGYALAHALEAFYKYTGEVRKEEVTVWALWFVVLGAGSQVGELIKWSFFTYIQESLALRLRSLTFRSLMRQDIGFFDDAANTPMGLTVMLERQSRQVSQMTSISLGNAFGSLCAVGCGVVLAFMGSWRLAQVCLFLVPVVTAAKVIVMCGQPCGGSPDRGTRSRAGAISSEAILNVRTVRSLLCEQHCLDRFWKAALAQGAGTCGAVKAGLRFGFSNSVSLLIYLTCFGYGAYLIDKRIIIQADMFQSIYCIMCGLLGAGMAATFTPDLARGALAAHDVFRVVDRTSKVDAVSPEGTHRSLGDATIAFRNLAFHYPCRPELPVLRGLDFSVQPGQSTALVGPSGSGKSSVFQMLLRFYDPTAGQVLVGGVCLTRFDVAWWRRQVALVGQEPVLFNMSLEDNVRYGKPEATRAEVEAAAQKANMDYALSGQVAWEESVGFRGSRLSASQKQRCAIARAVIREPSVLLLDEATSALDSISEQEVQKALDTVRTERTSFTIAHRLSTIQNSDKIILMVGGVICEQGTHEELSARGGQYCSLAGRPGGTPDACCGGGDALVY